MIRWARVWAVVTKDWRELIRSKQTIAALVVVPTMFVVVFPTVLLIVVGNVDAAAVIDEARPLLDVLPAGLLPPGLTELQSVVYLAIVYMLAPFFLLVPVMVSSIAASSAFVGEKERRTIEGLLYTPISDRELVLAKVLASMIPAVVISWAGFVIYTVLVNALGWPIFERFYFPTWSWAVLIVLVVPLVAFASTALVVAVSGRSSTVQGAQGVSMLLVLPLLLLIIGQAGGLVVFDVPVALASAAVLLAIDVVVFLLVVRQFNRERILTRL